MSCLSAKHAALRSKNKHCLVRNQNDVSELSYMSTRTFVLVSCENLNTRVGLVQSRHDYHIIEMLLVLAMIWLENASLGVQSE